MTNSGREAFIADVYQTFGRIALTHKTHEKEAERKTKQTLWLTWTNLVVITITLSAALAVPFTDGIWAQIISIAAALTAFGFAVVQLSFNPEREAAEHRSCAKKLLALRDSYCMLLVDEKCGAPLEELRARRDAAARQLHELFAFAPQTSGTAYSKASSALKDKEALVFTEEELDGMLPPELRRGGSN